MWFFPLFAITYPKEAWVKDVWNGTKRVRGAGVLESLLH